MQEIKSKPPRRSFYIYYIIVLALIMLFNGVIVPRFLNPSVEEVDYGTFLTMVDNGEVDKVQLDGDNIYFTSSDENEDESYYETIAFEDPDLVNRLYDNGCTFGRVAEKELSPIMSFLLTWVLPIVLFVAIGQWLGRRMMKSMGGMGNNPALQFGKSNAKVYVPSQTGIKFADVAGEEEAKENLQEIVDFLHNPQKYTDIGATGQHLHTGVS